MIATKACPVVFQDSSALRLLVFRHSAAGIQVVKGSIEAGEQASDAALRELREEAGISDAVVCQELGLWDAALEGQIWSFQLCAVRGNSLSGGATNVSTTEESSYISSGTTSMTTLRGMAPPVSPRSGVHSLPGKAAPAVLRHQGTASADDHDT